ncbi:Phosphatidylglycerol/phosphatidylinositol transfer protein [Coemansia thaxteri]|uniref:Phosphatidylglycerol/phosphatidylinositol transfer protein n=1 Tax=Coemansia thaxteri TaxID=2663907 RepID=A0A9W8BDP5_9FUNG|nr:Phosphatidylglycerol/phosphatidylinositol transfer protein [Coemansia thaxteri]KAJ2009154.1 Phosphatidylglycerol/phosphatidylinositol transfer protein [Coemansia thaxteri]KAJ2324763.1 Phosphatidylglycerol/phosphatidylinositol transfer protein [Coemansia sp. RSA 2673]KAJ2466262.1 Phosphatidylglycerol/phosphatidylinositol transfer protein [Coemansia sp. RSA 2322]KAJ2486287.1 Phosphatidylglycerol/phosphatidylinositol transfer protein [Coemansia sp. RSA 2320]
MKLSVASTYAVLAMAAAHCCAAAAIEMRVVVQDAAGIFANIEIPSIQPVTVREGGEGKNHTLNNIIRDVSEEDDLLDIKYADIDPEQPKRSTPLHINALAIVKGTIDSATANIKVKYGFITLLNRNYDLCKELETNLNKTCPVDEGPIELSIDVDVPGFIPPGWFHLEATAWRDSDSKQLGRILADVKF